jgi:hypothetical protein
MKSDLIDLDVEFVHATLQAICVTDGGKDVWIPKSVVEYDADKAQKGKVITITLPERWALDKGLL